MSPMGLSIDLGTSHTVAVLRGRDGEVTPLLFDGSPLLVSAVFARTDGSLAVGRDAMRSARLAPERFEPHPKRRIDDGAVMLGDAEVSVEEMFTAILRRVRDECVRVAGAVPQLTLTHPATWGPVRRQILFDATDAAGMPTPRLVPEPVAAANYFSRRQTTGIPVGSVIVVYDLGGGTFDITAVQHSDSGFEVLAADGAGDLGGVDIDDAVLRHVGRPHAGDPQWARLLAPETPDERRQRRHFLDDVRSSKEQLSRDSHVDLLIPLVEQEVHLTRGELEDLARPLLDRTVRLTQALIRATGTNPTDVAGLFLVGGASRMPLAATLLHRATGIAPTAIEQPETVVAHGAFPDDQARAVGPPLAATQVSQTEPTLHTTQTRTPLTIDHPTPAHHNEPRLQTGQPDDQDLAEEQFRRSADAGEAWGMNSLGILLEQRGDLSRAEEWYRKAGDAGAAVAMRNLGVLLRDRGDLDQAEIWFRKAGEAGDAGGMNNLGLLLWDRGDLDQAEIWLRKAADSGEALAMVNLGLLLWERGEVAGAEGWYRKAADAGETSGMYNLGVVLGERGEVAGAEEWYRKAADAGDAAAMCGVGVLLWERGDVAGAEGWYRKAADAGDVVAMNNLGVVLGERGDSAEAEEWYRKAADSGNAAAMNNLRWMLRQRGDLVEAKEWWRKAKEAGYPSVMAGLGNLFKKEPN